MQNKIYSCPGNARYSNRGRLLAIVVTGFLSLPLMSESVTVEDVMVRQQWEVEGRFLAEWVDSKKTITDDLISSLVSAHVVESVSGPILAVYPSKEQARVQINQHWIVSSVRALNNYELDDAEFYLTQLSPSLSLLEAQWVNSIKIAIEIQKNNLSTAQQIFNESQFDLTFTNIIKLQLTQALVKNGDFAHAKALMGSLPENTPLDNLIFFLEQRIALGTGKVTKEELMESVPIGSKNRSGILNVVYESVADGSSPLAEMELLLETSSLARVGPLTLEQVRLIQLLVERNAYFQLLEIGGQLSQQLLAAHQEIKENKQQYAKQEYFDKLASLNSEQFDIGLVAGLSSNSRWFAEELARTNSIIPLMTTNLEHLDVYLELLDKGSNYIADSLKVFPEVLSSQMTKYPEYIINLGPDVLLFERLLSRFIGTPENWDDRYVYLEGLAQWHTGRPFRNPWWRDSNASVRAATIELRRLMAKRKEKINQLNEQRWNASKDYVRDLKKRAQISLIRLTDSQNELKQGLGQSLKDDLRAPLYQIERDILWLAQVTMPNANQFDRVDPQPYYRLVQNAKKSGQYVVEANEVTLPLPDTAKLFEGLMRLADQSMFADIRRDAMMHTSSLANEIAEIKSFMSDPAIQAVPVDIDVSIRLLSRLVKEAEDQKTMIQAYYQLARAYEFKNQPEDTIEQLERIESLNVSYDLQDEVLFRLAEAQFTSGDYHAASENYELLSRKFPASQYIDNGNYMLGWSYFKQGEYRTALDHFFVLVDRYWFVQEEGAEIEERLIDDTMRVIGMTFANMNGADSVRKFFEQLGNKPYAENIYADLGKYYEDRLRFTDAAETFEAIVDLYPDSQLAPFYQSRIVQAYIDGEFPSKAWPAREAFVFSYGVDSLRWQQFSEQQRSNILEFLPTYLLALGQREHGKAQDTKLATGYRKAISYYDHLIAAVLQHELLPEVYFLKGEALFEIGQYEDAALSYQLAAYTFDGIQRSDEAGYAELISYQKLYNQAQEEGDKLKWLEIGIAKSETFVQTFSSSSYRPLVQTKLAEDMLLREDNEKALEFAEGLLSEDTDEYTPAIRLRLWRVAAHSSYELKNYNKSERGYEEAIALAQNTDELIVLKQRLIESIYRQAEMAQSDSRFEDAVSHYLRVGETYPESKIRPNAEFDAATVLIIIEEWQRALDVLLRFNKLYPVHELQGLMLEKLVVVHENLENWEQAAVTLNTIYEREGDSPLGRNALWRAASLQNKAGHLSKSIDLFKAYVNSFPIPLEPAEEARNEMHLIYMEQNKVDSAEYWLKQIILAHDKNKSEQTDRTQYLASEASLILGRKVNEAFGEVALTLPLEKTLPKKQGLMEQTIGHLNKTLGYGLAEHSTEATAIMGDLYIGLANALMDSERPSELNALELDQYELLLEEQVFPFEDQALELYEVNVGWIREGIYTQWIQYSLDQLQAILPARYNKPEEIPLYADSIK